MTAISARTAIALALLEDFARDPKSYIAGYVAAAAGDARPPGAGLDAFSFYLGRADFRIGHPQRLEAAHA